MSLLLGHGYLHSPAWLLLVPRLRSHLFQALLERNTVTLAAVTKMCRKADLEVQPGLPERTEHSTTSSHVTADETEALRWKVVRAAAPAGLESSPFLSQGSRFYLTLG